MNGHAQLSCTIPSVLANLFCHAAQLLVVWRHSRPGNYDNLETLKQGEASGCSAVEGCQMVAVIPAGEERAEEGLEVGSCQAAGQSDVGLARLHSIQAECDCCYSCRVNKIKGAVGYET